MRRHLIFNGSLLWALLIGIAMLLSLSPLAVGQQPSSAIQISSPVTGTVANPGQPLTINIVVTAASAFSAVGVVGQDIGFSTAATTPPFIFTLNIPNSIVGTKALAAVGITASGDAFFSQPITIDVEPISFPTSVTVSPTSIAFEATGSHIPFRVVGMFPDGTSLDVTQSTNTAYASSDLTVATVDSTGMVSAVGAGTATITASYGSPSQNLQATVSVTVDPPVITVSPATLAFPNQPVGTASGSQAVTVTNTSGFAMNILNVMASQDFAEQDNCIAQSPIAAGGTCSINLTFTPTANGPRQGTLSVANGFNSAPVVVNLLGNGVGPEASFSTGGLAFDSQLVGTASSQQTVNFTNSGAAALVVSGLTATGDFTSTSNCISSSPVASGGSCTVSVAFSPTVAGIRGGSLALSDNVNGSPQMLSLSGAGTDFALGAASGGSTSSSIPAGQSATYNLQLNALNGFTGSVSLSCTDAPAQATCTPSTSILAVSGAPAVPFTIQVTTTAHSLLPQSRRWEPWLRASRLQNLVNALLVSLLLVLIGGKAVGRHVKDVGAWASAAVLVACLAVFVSTAGCAGGGNNNPPPPSGTLSGTYNLIVTGTQQGVSRFLKLTLTVQ